MSRRVVSMWICRAERLVAPRGAGTLRVTCRRATFWALRGPSPMVSSTSGVRDVVLMGPVPVIGARHGREMLLRDVGGGPLAPGGQVEAGVDDVGEQRRGPAAPVEAHGHLPAFAGDGAQAGQDGLDLAGQGA